MLKVGPLAGFVVSGPPLLLRSTRYSAPWNRTKGLSPLRYNLPVNFHRAYRPLALRPRTRIGMAPARKRKHSAVALESAAQFVEPPPPARAKRQATKKKAEALPAQWDEVLDGRQARAASPDATGEEEMYSAGKKMKVEVDVEEDEDVPSLVADDSSALSSADSTELPPPKASKSKAVAKDGKASRVTSAPTKATADGGMIDPEADGDEEAAVEEIQAEAARPPPVNSDYLPLPWKGRLGYACLNTYLRYSSPPVFSSRTCRIASILEYRHPLANPDEPAHATKNRPDRDQSPDVARGQAYVEALGLANAKDIVKMLRWNDRYGIKFFRLSSEMFPFASHAQYGYKLAPFAAETLAAAGRVAGELGHRLTTHPGQFTQLGSPRKEVIDASIRDLEYHAELLSLLKLPPQLDRDAVMILHLGGVFGDKAATLDRFRKNYARLSADIKKRLVLENDDVSWSVHDLLPVCEELNIPMVLDYHHHNIIFDSSQIREGTKDIMDLYPRILATWKRKNITPKMHYSEPTPAAITGRQRRKHSPRVATLPPCPPDMDLMIEAKDKEQAVFELMRTFKLPGFDTFSNMIPNVRCDENKAVKTPRKKTAKKKKVKNEEEEDANPEEEVEDIKTPAIIPEDEVGMGGPEGRVYWPPGMEEWLRPVKRVVKPKAASTTGPKAKVKKEAIVKAEEELDNVEAAPPSVKAATRKTATATRNNKAAAATPKAKTRGKKKNSALEKTEEEDEDDEEEDSVDNQTQTHTPSQRQPRRGKKVNYAEE